jgi:hypothetical protein
MIFEISKKYINYVKKLNKLFRNVLVQDNGDYKNSSLKIQNNPKKYIDLVEYYNNM